MNNQTPFDPSQKSYPPPGASLHPLERPPAPPSQPPQSQPAQARRVAIPQSRPILTYGILGLNVVIFVIDYFVLHGTLTQLGAKDNAAIMAGELWRLVTPIFLHVDPIHIAVNSYSLYIIGPQVERSFGHWRFGLIYLLSGIAGVIASFTFNPNVDSIGASGAIFGLIGALLPMLYRNRSVMADTRRRIAVIIQVIVINLLFGLMPHSMIDNWGHVGGLSGGIALGWFATPLYQVRIDVDGSLRVDDRSSLSTAWLAAVVLGMLLGGLLYLEIVVLKGSIWPQGGSPV